MCITAIDQVSKELGYFIFAYEQDSTGLIK